MKNILIAALAVGLIAAPTGFAMAQSDTMSTQSSPSDVHNSVNGDIPRTHDKGAIVREDNSSVTGRSVGIDRTRPDDDTGGATLQGTGQ
jgi:hypothetical protein